MSGSMSSDSCALLLAGSRLSFAVDIVPFISTSRVPPYFPVAAAPEPPELLLLLHAAAVRTRAAAPVTAAMRALVLRAMGILSGSCCVRGRDRHWPICRAL